MGATRRGRCSVGRVAWGARRGGGLPLRGGASDGGQGDRARPGRAGQPAPGHGAADRRRRQRRREGRARKPGAGRGGHVRAPGRAQATAPPRGEPRGDGRGRPHRAHEGRLLHRRAAGVGRRQGRGGQVRRHRPAPRRLQRPARVRAAAGAGAGGPGQGKQVGPDRAPARQEEPPASRGRGVAGAGRRQRAQFPPKLCTALCSNLKMPCRTKRCPRLRRAERSRNSSGCSRMAPIPTRRTGVGPRRWSWRLVEGTCTRSSCCASTGRTSTRRTGVAGPRS